MDFKLLDNDDDEMEDAYKPSTAPNNVDKDAKATPQNLVTSPAFDEIKEKVRAPNISLICSIEPNRIGRPSSLKSQQLLSDYFHQKHWNKL